MTALALALGVPSAAAQPTVRDASGAGVVRALAREHGMDLAWESPPGAACAVVVPPSSAETAAALAVACAGSTPLRAERAGAIWVVRPDRPTALDAPLGGPLPRAVPVEALRPLLEALLRAAGVDGIVGAVRARDWTVHLPPDARTLRDALAGATVSRTDPWQGALAAQGIHAPTPDARLLWTLLEGPEPVLFVEVVDRTRDAP